MDPGSTGPIELMILHVPSGEIVRPSFEHKLEFEQSWYANLFLMQKPPLPPNCEWIKITSIYVPKRTFGQLLRKANATVPGLDPAKGKADADDIRLQSILMEL